MALECMRTKTKNKKFYEEQDLKELKVAYANNDRYPTAQFDNNYYLKEIRPDKLCCEIM